MLAKMNQEMEISKARPLDLKDLVDAVDIIQDALYDIDGVVDNYQSYGNSWARDRTLRIIEALSAGLCLVERMNSEFNQHFDEQF